MLLTFIPTMMINLIRTVGVSPKESPAVPEETAVNQAAEVEPVNDH